MNAVLTEPGHTEYNVCTCKNLVGGVSPFEQRFAHHKAPSYTTQRNAVKRRRIIFIMLYYINNITILITDVIYDIVTSYELASYEIVLTCVRVTFALISICSTCLLGHTTVKKGEIIPWSVGSILDIVTSTIRYIFFSLFRLLLDISFMFLFCHLISDLQSFFI
jgi:hypothetical protein